MQMPSGSTAADDATTAGRDPASPSSTAGDSGSPTDGDQTAPPAAEDLLESDGDDDELAREQVERERDRLRQFVTNLETDDIKYGGWFTKLVAQALGSYTDKVDWEYFHERYKGVPADAVVDQRIKMAARYAALEGGLSAGAYSAAVVATLGSAGAASPLTVPAAVTTMMVDVTFTTQLQLRLAHDVAVLYRVPIDTSDPEDMWKLIRVAFTIKGGGAISDSAAKAVPAVARPLIKRFYSGATLQAGRGLPLVGNYLLQRNVIKMGIPLVGIPLAAVLNRYTTLVAGRHAQGVFRNEARVIEVAERLTEKSRHPQLLLWVAWLVIKADGKISDDEALLMRHLVQMAEARHQLVDEALARLVDVDAAEVCARVDAEPGDLQDVVDAATQVAMIDGAVNARERAVLAQFLDQSRRGR